MKKVFLFLLFPLLNACAVYTSGYMPLVKEPRIPYTEQHQKKYDLTFSIGSLGTSPKFEVGVIKEIKEFFGKTHLFNKIHYLIKFTTFRLRKRVHGISISILYMQNRILKKQ